MKYDPNKPPDPQRWQEIDEQHRIDLVEQFHRERRIKLPKPRFHAVIHTIVENQAALGDEMPVAATLERLMGEGLGRHEAIHAIGSILTQHIMAIQQPGASADPAEANRQYSEQLEKLTKQSWNDEFGKE